MPALSAEEYRERAEARDRMAETTTSAPVREIMLYVASRWRSLADEMEARTEPAKPSQDQSQHNMKNAAFRPQHICRGAQMAQGSDTEVLLTAATLREQAALARRLVRGVSGETVRHCLIELADQLEAEASSLDDEQARAGLTLETRKPLV